MQPALEQLQKNWPETKIDVVKHVVI